MKCKKNKPKELGTAKRTLSEQLPPGWPKSPTTLETLHKEDQQTNDEEKNEYAESDNDLQFELTSPTEQEIAEEQEIEKQYEIQYNEATTYRTRSIKKNNVHTQCEDEDGELPGLLEKGDPLNDDSSTSSEESEEEQEWKENRNETIWYR